MSQLYFAKNPYGGLSFAKMLFGNETYHHGVAHQATSAQSASKGSEGGLAFNRFWFIVLDLVSADEPTGILERYLSARQVLISPAVSMGRCNTRLAPFIRTWKPAAREVDILCFSSHDEVEGVL
jgi:hypothetical protein